MKEIFRVVYGPLRLQHKKLKLDETETNEKKKTCLRCISTRCHWLGLHRHTWTNVIKSLLGRLDLYYVNKKIFVAIQVDQMEIGFGKNKLHARAQKSLFIDGLTKKIFGWWLTPNFECSKASKKKEIKSWPWAVPSCFTYLCVSLASSFSSVPNSLSQYTITFLGLLIRRYMLRLMIRHRNGLFFPVPFLVGIAMMMTWWWQILALLIWPCVNNSCSYSLRRLFINVKKNIIVQRNRKLQKAQQKVALSESLRRQHQAHNLQDGSWRWLRSDLKPVEKAKKKSASSET